jgi:hypothetical protein
MNTGKGREGEDVDEEKFTSRLGLHSLNVPLHNSIEWRSLHTPQSPFLSDLNLQSVTVWRRGIPERGGGNRAPLLESGELFS